jgi:hypothetical protein
MTEYTGDLRGARLVDADLSEAHLQQVQLRDARMRWVDFSGAVLRGVSLAGTAIDTEPAELEGLTINGVEVAPLIEAELRRRDPVRALLRPTDREGLRTAWSGLEKNWAATCDRVAAMPAGSANLTVEGEWSFAQTLRHLISATDIWLAAATDGRHSVHPWGVPFSDLPVFTGAPASAMGFDESATPSYDEVLAVRAERQAAVRDFIDGLSPDQLAAEHQGPPWVDEPISTLRCLRIILNEECEHRRFAERDLDLLAAREG